MFAEKHPAARAAQKSFMTKNSKNARASFFSKRRGRVIRFSYPAALESAARTAYKQAALSRVTRGV
jgi:hypothetical protein